MRFRLHLVGPALLIAAALPLAACGSSGSPSGASASGKRDTMLAFAQCMRTHGVPNFPDPGSNGNGGIEIQQTQRAGSGASMTVNGVSVSAPAFRSAQQSCRRYLPNGGHPPQLSASQRAAMLAFSRCMRSHGVPNFPDPTFRNGGVHIDVGPSSGIDPSSPAVQSAQRACSHGTFGPKVAVGPPPGG